MASKKILLIGGTGRTGLIFADGVLADGHSVTAVVRRDPTVEGTLASSGTVKGSGSSSEQAAGAEVDPNAAHQLVVGPSPNLNVVKMDLTADNLTPVMAGHDLVVVILGMWPKEGADEVRGYSEAAAAYVPAMKANGITRFFTVFGAGFLGPEVATEFEVNEHVPEMIVLVQRDMRRVYDIVMEAELNYSIWCPADYPGGPRSDAYVTAANNFPQEGNAFQATTGKVADSMIKEVNNNAFEHTRVGIARTD